MEVTEAVPTPRPKQPAGAGVRRTLPPRAADERPDLAPPAWVGRLLEAGRPAEHFVAGAGPFGVRVTDAPRFTLVTARVAGAAAMDDQAFERSAAEAYASVAQVLAARPQRHPVRFWNHVPGIRRTGPCGLDRYMVFNAGRFAACSDWFGGPHTFEQALPTASAVGHDGPDLVVHALAATEPGRGVENPRQVPPYKYSRRFGPRPPCFARATLLRDGPLVLVGGTASIRGETSAHAGDVRAQTLETFQNLAALLEAAAGGPRLRRFRSLRVYYVRRGDRPIVEAMVSEAFAHLHDVEYVRADLCRPELLVEIEGTADGRPGEPA